MNASLRYDTVRAPAPGAQEGMRHALQNPIVTALSQMMVGVLGEQVRGMFDRADDLLFDSAEKAQTAEERRLLMDTMRTLRSQRARIQERFRGALEEALTRAGEPPDEGAPDIDDVGQWSLQDGDALEERLAVANMESKAASMHAHELGEFKRRLATLSMLVGGALSGDAMSPGRIIRSFQDSMRNLTVDFPSKLVIYKLFDRVVLSRLSELFTGANQLLALNGVEPAANGSPARPLPDASGVRAPHPSSTEIPVWATQLDPATVGGFGLRPWPDGARAAHPADAPALAGVAAGWNAGAPPAEYLDAVLAQEIGNILRGFAQGRRPDAAGWLPPESVALVAGMFDRYYRDSRMPDSLKPMLGKLQLPAMKAALSDPRFFTDVRHPTRRAINDMFNLMLRFGAAADADKPAALGELHALTDSFARSIAFDPGALQGTQTAPLDRETAASFLREQEELQDRRNDTQVERVRRIVAHELRCHVGDRTIAPGVMRLLLSGFGPILGADYIRGGQGSAPWRESLELVDRVIDSLQGGSGGAEQRRTEEAEIVAAVSKRLARIGFSDDRLSEVIAGLLEVYLANEESRAGEPVAVGDDAGPAVQEPRVAEAVRLSPEKELQGLLSILLVPSTWYTLVDTDTATKHWVRVKTHYAAQNAVLFSHYMEERFVRWHASSLATALLDGTAALIDPSPELHAAAERLGHLPFARTHDPLEWTGADGKPIGMER